MSWLKDIMSVITGNEVDVEQVRTKIQSSTEGVSDEEIKAYIDDIDSRVKRMVKDLKTVYAKYNIQFSGFKSFDVACNSLSTSLKDGRDEAYNNLVKLESTITSEQKRHLGLIKMAVTKDGKKVYDQIMLDPGDKLVFNKIFGSRDTNGTQNDGTYQRLWSEVHKLSEYIITRKNKVYH
jgi:hypothetical protein